MHLLVSILTVNGRSYRLPYTTLACKPSGRGYQRRLGEEYTEILLPLLDGKKAGRAANDNVSSQETSDRLSEAKRKLQRESRRCANEYRNKLCSEIQEASDRGDKRTMYQNIKVALGPQVNKVKPIKSKSG